MATMKELIKEVPQLVEKIDKDIEREGQFFFSMYGSYKSTIGRIDEKYKNAINEWCRCYGYKLIDLHDYYHTYKITEIK